MSRLLAIETASEVCSVALLAGGETLVREHHEPRRHAELLLPAVRELLEESGLALADLDAIAFGRGPGSFTSLRIGIGVVQGLAWGADIGVVPVSSLAVLAQGAVARHQATPGQSILCALDARMGEVFTAGFEVADNGLVEVIGEEAVLAPGQVTPPPGTTVIAVGNGFERYPALLRDPDAFVAVYSDLWPSATHLAELASAWLADHEPLSAHEAQPVYIRDNVAEKSG